MIDTAFWWTGAAAWIAALAALTAIVAFLAWRAIYATAEVGRQLYKHHIVRKRTRAEWLCTPGEAWHTAFYLGPRSATWWRS